MIAKRYPTARVLDSVRAIVVCLPVKTCTEENLIQIVHSGGLDIVQPYTVQGPAKVQSQPLVTNPNHCRAVDRTKLGPSHNSEVTAL